MAKMHARWVAVVLTVAIWLPVPVRAVPILQLGTDVVGTWVGTWKNLKFGSTGAITATITQPDGNSLSIQYNVTGGVFGCGDPSGTFTLVEGTDYTDNSVHFTRVEPVLGTVTVQSLKKGYKLKGGGTMACGDGSRVPSWKFTAKYKKTAAATKLTAKFAIKLAPKGKAKSIATITKQP